MGLSLGIASGIAFGIAIGDITHNIVAAMGTAVGIIGFLGSICIFKIRNVSCRKRTVSSCGSSGNNTISKP